MSFKNKVVIVTGASSGIGAAAAIKFAEEGAQVCLVGRNEDNLNRVAKKCENSLTLVADVSKEEDAKRIISETVKHFGQLDVLVNNAGIWIPAGISQEGVMGIYDQIMAINLRAPVLLTHIAVPHLVKTKGNIVNVSSVGAIGVLFKGNSIYNASKAALDHFSRSVALELAESGVRVNTVNPGPVITNIARHMPLNIQLVAANQDNMKKTTALERVSEPEETAEVILFLASDKAKGITGSSYVTDNGALLKGSM